jgi:hypothetical protein
VEESSSHWSAVSDGSYIRQLHPELCSAAMIMECQTTRNRIVVSFSEQCKQANAYRGELLGLMAIHLLLLSSTSDPISLQTLGCSKEYHGELL